MTSISYVGPDLVTLASSIARELLADLKAKRLSKIGIEEVKVAIDAREVTRDLGEFSREQLITMTLRRLINGV